MRLLVLGAGGIGGYFGGRLAAAGADVTFLVRPGRAMQLARDGLVIRSPTGDLTHPVRFIGGDGLADEGRFDAVLLTCKAYDLEAALAALAPAVVHGAAIVPLLNGVRHLERLDFAFGRSAVLGGLCQIATTLTRTGEVLHLSRLHLLMLGARAANQRSLVEGFATVAQSANFESRTSDDIAQDMWEKFVMLASMAAMTCLMRANVGEIMQTDEGEGLMLEALSECDLVARAAAHPSPPEFLERARSLLTERGSSFAASMLRDVERGGATEAAHFIGDMVVRSREAGLTAPVLRMAGCHLQAHAARQRAGRA